MAIAKTAVSSVNFGELDMYVAGGLVPEGDYIITDMTIKIHQATDQQTGANRGAARLGVMITFLPLNDPRPENALKPAFYSMGGKADQTYQPNPETGKGLVAVPGASGNTLSVMSNWAYFLKSLYDSGLPKGIFTNDTTVLEGTHVHIAPVPEPEDRKNMSGGAATGEAAEVRKLGTIAVVTEIKDDGKPWEGTGGIPAAGKKATKPASKTNGAVKTAPAVTPTEEADEDLRAVALSAIADVLGKPVNINGLLKLTLNNETFKVIEKARGNDIASAVRSQIFSSDAALSAILADVQYQIVGSNIKPL